MPLAPTLATADGGWLKSTTASRKLRRGSGLPASNNLRTCRRVCETVRHCMSERVLVLAPHTDDAEFGCGGTIAKFVAAGKEVFQVAFSAAEASLATEFPPD